MASYVTGLAATRPAPVARQALDALETEVHRTTRERRTAVATPAQQEETA